MVQSFTDQGGAASSNPSTLKRWITSKIMQKMVCEERLQRNRSKTERKRVKRGLHHRVEYYHQVDDAYSHLAAQTLSKLLDSYDIELVPYLAGPPSGGNAPEPELLLKYALRDAHSIALHYGLTIPPAATLPKAAHVTLATRILAVTESSEFPETAVTVGQALWSDSDSELESLAKAVGLADTAATQAAVAAGNERRKKLGHFSGAMFYYAGEWYWGVDRLYHLENRLLELGAGKSRNSSPVAPRPEIDCGTVRDNGSLTLEFYPSLRSPYSSIIFDRTLRLVEESGVKMVMRPVLPMVMRGVSLTLQKGMYIFSDAAREARTLGLKWGGFYDPIGNPVRRAFSLYPWAREQGKDVEFLGGFLKAAFFDAVNTNQDAGLKKVVEDAGLSWQEAQSIVGNADWEEELEENRLAMLNLGIWGVPSYRLFDRDGQEVLSAWGQDRLWLVAREIKRLLKSQDMEGPHDPDRSSCHPGTVGGDI